MCRVEALLDQKSYMDTRDSTHPYETVLEALNKPEKLADIR